jgi:hypothetical protein
MNPFMKIAGLAGAMAISSAVSVSAATLIDFTDSSTPLVTAEYSVTNNTGILIQNTGGGPGAGFPPLAGEYDGLGISNDEITYPSEWITITFVKPVTLTAVYFLDVFFSGRNPSDTESGNVTVGGAPGSADGSIFASVPTSEGVGFAQITGLSLKGTTFTFWAGPGSDDTSADVALAAIEIAPIPLPAGALLIGTALGALGLVRRRKTA